MGFENVEFLDRQPYGIDDVSLFPLFTPELVELMRRVIPPERQAWVATSVVVTARKP